MIKNPPQQVDLDAFCSAMADETDRACGVLGAALLDLKLKLTYERRLRCSQKEVKELLDGTGPLASFGTRIRVARALAWINEDAYTDLNTVRDIRNDFAHQWDHTLGFDNQSIADRCSNLRSASAYIHGWNDAAAVPGHLHSDVIRSMGSVFKTPRRRYENAVTFLSQYLDDLTPAVLEYQGPDFLADVRAVSARHRW